MISADEILDMQKAPNYLFCQLLKHIKGRVVLSLDWQTDRVSHTTISATALQNWIAKHNLTKCLEFGHGSGHAALHRYNTNKCQTVAIANTSIAITLPDIIKLILSATKKISECFTAKTIQEVSETIAGEVLSKKTKTQSCYRFNEVSRQTGIEIAARVLFYLTNSPETIVPKGNTKVIPRRDGTLVTGQISNFDTFLLLRALRKKEIIVCQNSADLSIRSLIEKNLGGHLKVRMTDFCKIDKVMMRKDKFDLIFDLRSLSHVDETHALSSMNKAIENFPTNKSGGLIITDAISQGYTYAIQKDFYDSIVEKTKNSIHWYLSIDRNKNEIGCMIGVARCTGAVDVHSLANIGCEICDCDAIDLRDWM